MLVRFACIICILTVLAVNPCSADCGFGDRGPEVYRVQVELLKQGFPVRVLDGKYGPETEKLVREFQRRCGLAETGFVDKDTYYSLLSREDLCTEVNRRVLRLLDIATLMLSTRYAWGGENSRGFDCSGFTEYCYDCAVVFVR